MRKLIIRSVFGLIMLAFILGIGGFLFVSYAPAFGSEPDVTSMKQMETSSHFNGQVFQNLVSTRVQTPDTTNEQNWAKFLYYNLFPPAGKNPSKPLPSVKLEYSQMNNGDFVWLGHSTILMKLNNKFIITDPVFHNASPIPGSVTQFAMQHRPQMSHLPDNLSAVLISHDHYDHLDYKAIKKLAERVELFLVPLGVGSHLRHWGVSADKIVEMDWYNTYQLAEMELVFTPSRHFSGRGLTNAFTTLWGSWVIQSPSDSTNIFFSGDSGYFDEFKIIGQKYGPFDIAFMENGAYNTNWRQIHFMPEQSVKASLDLQAKKMFPIHWGKFDLSVHPWKEPIKRATKAAALQDVEVVTPLIGEIFNLELAPQRTWWEFE